METSSIGIEKLIQLHMSGQKDLTDDLLTIKNTEDYYNYLRLHEDDTEENKLLNLLYSH